MKILFKNTTKYDKDNCNNFIEFHYKKYGKREILKLILSCIILIYIAIFNIIYKNWILLIAVAVIAVIAYLFNNVKINKKKKEKIKKYTFYFYEKRYIKIKYKRQFERISYFEIKKVFETDKYFYLYTDENHSLILDKEGFEVGTCAEFSQFIKKKFPLKYSNEKGGRK